ncbi:hypothetical protein ARTHRO8AJ_390090 [Arthrobacter sp. 8AJ]|nr:hypothetical protein ARTHRO8AJ_390090 [Arthrobacter sp. 8AJ]
MQGGTHASASRVMQTALTRDLRLTCGTIRFTVGHDTQS